MKRKHITTILFALSLISFIFPPSKFIWWSVRGVLTIILMFVAMDDWIYKENG